MRIRSCKKCRHKYVLVGGSKKHICPSEHWRPVSYGKSKMGRKSGRN